MKRNLLMSLAVMIIPFFGFAKELSIDQEIEEEFKPFADWIGSIVFYPVSIVGISVPIVLIVLLLGALFFTLYFTIFSNFTVFHP